MEKDIVVSICCITYNHEKYIKDALEGFINQKTTFEFEVLIHDDASTDETAEIIREYEKKYPEIIKPIYQKENQWKKHIGINKTYNYPRAKGKYIALCEGDDYWTDKYKLQKQVDFLEENMDCSFCFSNAIIKDMSKDGTERIFVPYNKKEEENYIHGDRNLSVGELARLGFIPTASFMFRVENLDKFPEYYDDPCPAGDRKISLYHTALGYAHFFDEPMTVYRENVQNSALDRWSQYSKKQRWEHNEKMVHLKENVDKFTNYKFSSDLEYSKEGSYREMLMSAQSLLILRDSRFMAIYKKMTTKDKFQFWIEMLLPEKLVLWMKNFKNHKLT